GFVRIYNLPSLDTVTTWTTNGPVAGLAFFADSIRIVVWTEANSTRPKHPEADLLEVYRIDGAPTANLGTPPSLAAPAHGAPRYPVGLRISADQHHVLASSSQEQFVVHVFPDETASALIKNQEAVLPAGTKAAFTSIDSIVTAAIIDSNSWAVDTY